MNTCALVDQLCSHDLHPCQKWVWNIGTYINEFLLKIQSCKMHMENVGLYAMEKNTCNR